MLNTDNDPNKLCNWQQVLSFEWEVYWRFRMFNESRQNMSECSWLTTTPRSIHLSSMILSSRSLIFRWMLAILVEFQILRISLNFQVIKKCAPVFWGSVFLVFNVNTWKTKGRLFQVLLLKSTLMLSKIHRPKGAQCIRELKSESREIWGKVTWRCVFLDPYPLL